MLYKNSQLHVRSSLETIPSASSPRRNVPKHSQTMPRSNTQENNKTIQVRNEANNSPQTPKKKRDRRHRRERRARERKNRNESFIHDARWANQRSLVPGSSSVPVRVTQSVWMEGDRLEGEER